MKLLGAIAVVVVVCLVPFGIPIAYFALRRWAVDYDA